MKRKRNTPAGRRKRPCKSVNIYVELSPHILYNNMIQDDRTEENRQEV